MNRTEIKAIKWHIAICLRAVVMGQAMAHIKPLVISVTRTNTHLKAVLSSSAKAYTCELIMNE
jgi:hypothetical protein